MSLDKKIHTHLDELEKIEQNLLDDIDKIITSIDKSQLVSNPDETLADVILQVRELIVNEYFHKAAVEGQRMAKLLQTYKVKVDGSKDPNKNEDIL